MAPNSKDLKGKQFCTKPGCNGSCPYGKRVADHNKGVTTKCLKCERPYPVLANTIIQFHTAKHGQANQAKKKGDIGKDGSRSPTHSKKPQQQAQEQKKMARLETKVADLQKQLNAKNEEDSPSGKDDDDGPLDLEEQISSFNADIAFQEKAKARYTAAGESAAAANAHTQLTWLQSRRDELLHQRQAGKKGSAQLQSAEGQLRRANLLVQKAEAQETEAEKQLQLYQQKLDEAKEATNKARDEQTAKQQALAKLKQDLAAAESVPAPDTTNMAPRADETQQDYSQRKCDLLATLLGTLASEEREKHRLRFAQEWQDAQGKQAQAKEAAVAAQKAQVATSDAPMAMDIDDEEAQAMVHALKRKDKESDDDYESRKQKKLAFLRAATGAGSTAGSAGATAQTK